MIKSGRNVVLLGCSRGIGLGVLKHLSEESDCKSLIGVVRSQADVERIQMLFPQNGKVKILRGDVTDPASMSEVATTVTRLGVIPDLLICNAGVLTSPKSFTEVTASDMRTSFEVNVLGPLNAMKAFLPLMKDVDGAVMVNVSSGWGLWGETGQTTYVASKHALEGLMKCAAKEVASDKVSIVTVRPGVVFTEMLGVALGAMETAKEIGVPVDKFAPHFCKQIMSITKADSGNHIDCGYKGE